MLLSNSIKNQAPLLDCGKETILSLKYHNLACLACMFINNFTIWMKQYTNLYSLCPVFIVNVSLLETILEFESHNWQNDWHYTPPSTSKRKEKSI